MKKLLLPWQNQSLIIINHNFFVTMGTGEMSVSEAEVVSLAVLLPLLRLLPQ